MKTIKLHLGLSLVSYGLLSSDSFYYPIICRSFIYENLDKTPPKITLWIVPSKNGNIVIGKPIYRIEWAYKILGWKWYGERSLQPIYFPLGGMLKPGRYNVYLSEGWV